MLLHKLAPNGNPCAEPESSPRRSGKNMLLEASESNKSARRIWPSQALEERSHDDSEARLVACKTWKQIERKSRVLSALLISMLVISQPFPGK